MYQLNPLLEAIKLDPSKIESQLKDPAVKEMLMKAKSKIHKNPFLRDKFYDITTLHHQTKSPEMVASIKEKGLIPHVGGTVKNNFNNVDGIQPLVYTSKKPYRYSHDKDLRLKIRLPNEELKHRVADPIEQRNYLGGHSYMNFFGKSVLHNDPVLKGKKLSGKSLDINSVLAKMSQMEGKPVTLKELRRRWSKMTSRQKKEFIYQFCGYYPANFFPDTVALTSKVEPEWIVGSSKAIKHNFEDQLKKDPQRTTAMINDLMKRS